MALEGGSSSDASAPPPPPSPPPPTVTRDRRERKLEPPAGVLADSSRRSGRADGPQYHRPKCVRHCEAHYEARSAALFFSRARFASPRVNRSTESPWLPLRPSPPELRSSSAAHEDRGLRGEACAKNTSRVGYSYTIHFSVRAFGD